MTEKLNKMAALAECDDIAMQFVTEIIWGGRPTEASNWEIRQQAQYKAAFDAAVRMTVGDQITSALGDVEQCIHEAGVGKV